MKKLKLSALNLGHAEVLSREQLKKVLGGLGSGGSGGTYCECYCCYNSPEGCGGGTVDPYVTSCTSNEDCQQSCLNNMFPCPEGTYMAALCKG